MTHETFDPARRRILAGATGLALAPTLAGVTRPAAGAAPMMGVAQPTHYRYPLGGFEVIHLWDGLVELDGPHPIFGQDQAAEDVQALAVANFLPATRMQISFMPVLVNTGQELVLFDTGNDPNSRPTAGKLRDTIKSAGYSLEQIDRVVITHCHPDHIGGLMTDGQPTFPNAQYAMGQAEYDFWSPVEKAEGPTARVGSLVQSNVVPLAEGMTFLQPDDEVVAGIRAVDAFGHTPGHMAFHIESEGKRLLLMADTTNHYVVSLQRPDWHVRFDMDKDKAAATRKRILDMAAADGIPITGYHMPFPSVGFVEKTERSYRWVQPSYQLVM